jgi:hypothetical protein
MRRFCIIVAAASVIVSPAVAQSGRNSQGQRPAQSHDRPTSNDVYSGERYLGRDPDPNIRFQILREQNWRRG